jgi:ribosomal protein S18 acetylase RimI-like enzyme
MEIRQIKIDDYEQLLALWSKAGLPFKPKGRDNRKAMAKEMAANPGFFLGAVLDNQLVGAVVISCDLRKGWINRLAVNPAYRGRGVAKKLIDESEKTLRKRGVRIFCALIENDNIVSKNLFKKYGYVEHHDITYFSKRDSEEV